MCVVSYVGDYWREKTVPNKWPEWEEIVLHPTRTEFDELKKDVEELKELLKQAKLYDEAVGEPDCEVDDKVKLIKEMAEKLGVDLEDIFD